MVPHGYQEEAIQHLCDVLPRQRAAVNGSDMGTGKTLQGVEVMRRLGLPTLVVCPKSTIASWTRHAAAQETELDAVNWELLRTGRTPYGTWTSTEEFRWHDGIKFLIFDEAQRAMGRWSKNSELVRAARRQNILAMPMSATLADTPMEMDALGYVLRLHDGYRPKTTLRDLQLGREVVSFNQWSAKHGCGLDYKGQWAFLGNDSQRLKNMARISAALYPAKGVRIRIEDLGDQFPEQQVTAELYDIEAPGRMDALYAKMAEALAKLAERTADYGGGPLSDLLEAQQQIELLKVPVFVDQTEEAISAGRSVCIFVRYRQTIEELCDRLGTDCFIDGSQTGDSGARRREANRLRFVNDHERAIVCNVEAGGVGLDLGDIRGVYPRTTLASAGHNAKSVRQLGGRTRRADSKSKSLVRYIFAFGTCEESIQKTLARKLDCLDALNDQDLFPQNMKIDRTW